MQPYRLRLCRPHFLAIARAGRNSPRLPARDRQELGPLQLLHATHHHETQQTFRQAFRVFTRLAFGRAATRRR